MEIREGRVGDVEGEILVVGEGKGWCGGRVRGGGERVEDVGIGS